MNATFSRIDAMEMVEALEDAAITQRNLFERCLKDTSLVAEFKASIEATSVARVAILTAICGE